MQEVIIGNMIVKIPIQLSSWNDIIAQCRANKYHANSHKKQEMKDISWFVRKIPPITNYPVEIVFKWHIRNPRCDLDNKSCKSILDCMQNLGILENDNVKHITAIHNYAILDKDEYVEMEII